MKTLVTLLTLCLCGVESVEAHHSFAAYDESKTYTVSGTLKEFFWGAPHTSLVVLTTGADGKDFEVRVVSFAPIGLARQGFHARDLSEGQKVELRWHPNRSGAVGGSLVSLKLEDGRVLGGEIIGPNGPAPNIDARKPAAPDKSPPDQGASDKGPPR